MAKNKWKMEPQRMLVAFATADDTASYGRHAPEKVFQALVVIARGPDLERLSNEDESGDWKNSPIYVKESRGGLPDHVEHGLYVWEGDVNTDEDGQDFDGTWRPVTNREDWMLGPPRMNEYVERAREDDE